ncbi:hypothetical protein N1495_08700 [Streptococcus didelphis]|uniref:DUF2127 domain-containing protein n=1 Tax=Streptococcus didelphis TaxID=102886 RepID=A0ABY9LIU0_9STRE|nr:hypothetical protein [Streptococcus didelphis]WMB28720.1 hypothetical protein N1496_04455 [Streptococcus didelphis]WMB29376.1 hypothetical protein N1495_08700 [Streptococcus didelphis]
MISYEKVRQSLKTLNIVIIVLNAITVVFGLIGLVSLFLVRDNENLKATMTPEAYAAIEKALTPFSLFMTIIALLMTAAILVFVFINQKNIRQNAEISYLPYYLGFGVVALNIISQLLVAPSILNILIQLAFVALYFFAFKKAKTLNEKEEETEFEA